MPRPLPHTHPQAGFTLLELSAVLVIIAIVTAGTFSMGSSMIESARKVNTTNKLDAIEEALLAFRLANNRLPCPTDATLTDIPANAATYGYEAANSSGTCIGGSPAANYSYTLTTSTPNAFAGSTVAEGAVPVRALGLPDEFQWDGWGRKFAYAVWTPLTATNAFITYGVNPNCGAITVENAGHGYRTTAGAYALISYGPNGHGGYLKSGAQMLMGSDNNDELQNCHCPSTSGGPIPFPYTGTYVEQDVTQSNPNDSLSVFDDIVRFKDRWQMQNAYDTYVPTGEMPCTLGVRIDGPVASANLSVPITSNWQVFSGIDINNDGVSDLVLATWGDPMLGIVLFGTHSWPSVIDLSSYALTGSNGFTISIAGGYCGGTIAGPFLVADFDGDGHNDLAMGDNGCNGNPHIVVVFGGQASYQSSYSTSGGISCNNDSNINGTQAACIAADTALGSYASWVAAGRFTTATAAGLLFNEQCSGGGGTCGARYAPGGARPWPAAQALSTMSGTIDFTNLPSGSVLFSYLADVNNDGYADLITSPRPIGIVYGGAGPGGSWGSSYSFNNVNKPNNPKGMSIAVPAEDGGTAADFFGNSIAVGDLSGDGKNDLIVGDRDWGCCQGRTFAIYGPLGTTSWAAGWEPSTTLNGTTGSTLLGSGAGGVNDGPADGSRWASVPTLQFGDLNGDGKQDLIQWNVSPSAYNPYVGIVFGGGGYGSSYIWGSDSKSVTITGDTPTMVAVGDLNGDGIPDLIIGCGGSNTVYIIWGQKSWPQTIDLTTLTASQGTIINGTRGGGFGQTVAAWDVNGDSVTDLIICAPGQTNNGIASSGSCYVLWGHKGAWLSSINDSAIGG